VVKKKLSKAAAAAALTAATAENLSMGRRTTMAEKPRFRYDTGDDTPFHTHTDQDGEQWDCNSTYCASMRRNPPSKGGQNPIAIGQEPWRGRQ